MKLSDIWFSTMAENDEGQPIFITGRDDLNEFKDSKKFKERIEIYWPYKSIHNGMPEEKDGELMEKALNAIREAVEKDKLAILTGIYTGNNERTMVFYARTSKVFGERLNNSLSQLPTLPIKLYVEIDPDWKEYTEMCEIKPYAE